MSYLVVKVSLNAVKVGVNYFYFVLLKIWSDVRFYNNLIAIPSYFINKRFNFYEPLIKKV